MPRLLLRNSMQIEADLSNHSFFFGIPAYDGLVVIQCVRGMLETATKLSQLGVPHMWNVISGGALIDNNRNVITKEFLDSPCDILIWIDADISFSWEQMERLLVLATKYPVVCGSYCSRQDPPKFMVKLGDLELNEDGVMPIDHVGMGFMAVQRQVFDKIPVEVYADNKDRNLKAYHRMVIKDGIYTGEDVYFLQLCKEHGFQPYVDPGIELGHMGYKEFNTPFRALIEKLTNTELDKTE